METDSAPSGPPISAPPHSTSFTQTDQSPVTHKNHLKMESSSGSPPVGLSTTPTVTGSRSRPSKGIMISERLKKIRENRSTKKDTTKQTSASDLTASPSSPLSLPTSPTPPTLSASSSPGYSDFTPSVSTSSSSHDKPTSNVQGVAKPSSNSITIDEPTEMSSDTQQSLVEAPVETDTTSAIESMEQQDADKTKLLNTEEIQSTLNSDSAVEGAKPSQELQKDDAGPNLYEHTLSQIGKASSINDIPMEDNVDDDDDELPPVPPPPIPDLPPPPDDLPADSDSEEMLDTPSQGQAVVDEVVKVTSVTTKSSFRTIRKKEEWTRKSEQLDSVMLDPLPLLISTKASDSRLPDPLPEESESPYKTSQLSEEEMESLTNKDILNSSSESLPSLPETPPPDLPDAPPPDLPSSFPPDGIEFESDVQEERVVSETLLITSLGDVDEESMATSSLPTSNTGDPATESITELAAFESTSQPVPSPEPTPLPSVTEQPPTTYSDEVQFRKPKRATNETNSQDVIQRRRSAFDALVAVEPTAEEKKEPKLSAEQRRSLALEASRRSDADTSTLLEQWNAALPSVEQDAEKDDDISNLNTPKGLEGTEEIKESDEDEKSRKTVEVTVNTSSSATEEIKSKEVQQLLSTEGLSLARPRSTDDLQPNLKHTNDNESRWSLPPGSDVFQSVKVISEGVPPSSPDLKFTRVTSQRWKKSHLTEDGSPSLSASTGQLFNKGRDINQNGGEDNSKSAKIISWHTFHSSSESLPPFAGLKKSSRGQPQPLSISPLAATVSIASTSGKVEPSLQDDSTASAEIQGSPQQISYAQKLQVQSKATERKRRSLVLSEDDQIPFTVETFQEDNQATKVQLRRNVKNLQLASIEAERSLDSPRPASLVLDRDILKVLLVVL